MRIEPAQSRRNLRRCNSSVDWLARACCVIAIGGFSSAAHSASQGLEGQKPRELSAAAGGGLEENAGRQDAEAPDVASSLRPDPSAETLWKRVFGSGWVGARLRPNAVAKTSSKDGKVGFRAGSVGLTSTAEARAAGGKPAFWVASVASTLDALTPVKIGVSDPVGRSNTYARSVMRDDPDVPGPNFYQSHPEAFSQLDQFLGYTYARSASTTQDGRDRNLSMSLRLDSGFAISNFDPSRSMLKLGPIYFDITSIEAGMLWTDYRGSPSLTAGFAKPGWAAYVQTGFRVVGRLTDTLYIAAGGSIVYLPFVNRWAFDAGYGTGGPNAGLSLLYANHFGEWDVSLYERFSAFSGLGYFFQQTETGSDQVGRYVFGIPFGVANNVFTESLVFWSNLVGASATRPVFDGNWLLRVSAEHTDFWRSFNFTHAGAQDTAEIRLGYVGANIPFRPYAYYRVSDPDGIWQASDFLIHQAVTGFNGHLTENLTVVGNAGMAFYTGADATRSPDYLWNLNFQHTMNANFSQSLSFGQWIFTNSIFSKTVLSDYINYGFTYQLNRRSWLRAFVQYDQRQVDLLTGGEIRSLQAGSQLSTRLSETTQLQASVFHQKYFDAFPGQISDQWIYRASLTQYFGRRLSGTVFYQHQDDSGRGVGLHEHVVGCSLRHVF